MSEVTPVWLLAAALDGEDTFWLGEPTNVKPIPEDWKACNCRWLYPVLQNVSRFADLRGFDSTDAVYEVEWSGSSRVLRAATLLWNVQAKRQKVDGTTYVFVPAEEMKVLEETYKKFVKIESMKRPPPRVVPTSAGALPPPTLSHTLTPSPPPPPATQSTDPATEVTAPITTPPKTATTPPESDAAPVPPGKAPASDLDVPFALLAVGDTASVVMQTVSTVDMLSESAHQHWAAEADDPIVQRGMSRRARPSSATSAEAEGEKADSEAGEGSTVSSAMDVGRTAARSRPGNRNLSLSSHKRQTPHRGTTTYQAPVQDRAMGDHRSNEAFEWPEMYVVHRGSVDFLCPLPVNNTYGFRLDRVLHDGFPVFLLFSSPRNNSQSIDRYARGVPVFQKAKLSGEGGEGAVRQSVLVLTRLSSSKHQPHYRRGHGRRRTRRDTDSDDETTTSEEEEDLESEEDDDDDNESGEEEEEEEQEEKQVRPTRAAPRSKKAKTEPPVLSEGKVSEATTAAGSSRKRASKPALSKKAVSAEEEALQAVSVNFWTDPPHVAPSVPQLAKEFPFRPEGADAPQTVVFSDGVCVTYTSATAAKHAPAEKKRSAVKHGTTAASSSEDADLSMLNEHILNALAQVRMDEL